MTHISLTTLVEFHRALSDPLRIKLIRLLLDKEYCVCELIGATEEVQYKVSRHLAILKQAGLVQVRREGTWIFYKISPDLSEPWIFLLHAHAQLWDKDPAIIRVLERINTMKFRPEEVECKC